MSKFQEWWDKEGSRLTEANPSMTFASAGFEAGLASAEEEIHELKRMMCYCNKCSNAPGEPCEQYCTRDGSRDNQVSFEDEDDS